MELRHGCVYYCFYTFFFLIVIGNVSSSAICPPGFEYVDTNLNPVCIGFFNISETWEKAYNVCRHYSSYLYYYKSTDLEEIRKFSSKAKYVHIGIRKKRGVYLWSDPHPLVFSINMMNSNESNASELLWEHGEPSQECVGINLLTKKLRTYPCNVNKSNFICIGNVIPEPSMLCDDDWEFSYLSGNCIKKFTKSANYATANRECNQLQAEIMNYESLKALTPAFLFEGIHNSTETGVFKQVYSQRLKFCYILYWSDGKPNEVATNCDNRYQYICQKNVKKLEIEVNFVTDVSCSEVFEIPAVPYSKFFNNLLYLEVKLNGSKYNKKDLSRIAWWKDDKPIERCVNSSCTPLLVNTPDITKQGRYYVSVIIPRYPYTVFSKTKEIYFSDVSTYLLNISGTNIPYNESQHDQSSRVQFENFLRIVNGKMEEMFQGFNIDNLPKPTWYLHYIEKLSTEVNLHIYLYFNFANVSRPKNEKNDVFVPLHNFINNKVRMTLFRDWPDSVVNLSPIGLCFEETKQGGNNINITWNRSYHGRHIVSTPPCLKRNWDLVTRTCQGGYLTGARWEEFDYSKCYRRNEVEANPKINKCNPNYDFWKHDTCIKKFPETADWFQAQKKCGKEKGFLFTPMINSNSQLQEFGSIFDNGEIWLGGRRIFDTFQWLAFYPRIINNTDEIVWGAEEPKLQNDCLSGTISGRKLVLYSKPCHEKMPFVCMHKAVHAMLYATPRCPDHWKGWNFLKKCYMHTDRAMNWTQALNYCNKKGGKLAVLENPYANVLLKNYVLYFSIEFFSIDHRFWWIGVRKLKVDSIWENKPDLRYVDWDPRTDFGQNNTAACLKVGDSGVTWYASNPNNSYFGICEIKANTGRVVSHVKKIFDGVFECISDRRYYNSITWYKDGLIVNGTRGLTYTDDRYLILSKLLSSRHVQFKTPGRLQGYYWCEVDQEDPFVSVASNKELYLNEAIWTFSGEFLSRKNFNQFDPSTTEFWDEMEEVTRKVEDELLPKKPFATSAFFHKITKEYGKTKLRFFIYVERSFSKKRSNELQDKTNYKKYLEKHIELKLGSSRVADELQLESGSFKIGNSGECSMETTTINGMNLTWNETRAGKFAIAGGNCVTKNGEPVIRRCLGNFTYGTYWGPVEGSCSGQLSDISINLKKLSQEEVENTKQTSENLKVLTNASSELKAIDLHYVAVTMEKLADVQVHQREDVQDMISTMDNIMNMDPDIITSSKNKVNASTRIVASMEKILEKNINPIIYSKPNLLVYSWLLSKTNKLAGLMVKSSDDDELGEATSIMMGKELPEERCRAGILLPSNLLQERIINSSTIDFIIYKNDSLFLSGSKDVRNAVVSPVLYAHIPGDPVLLETNTIEIVLQINQMSNQIPNSEKCVYWDYSLNNEQGGWSDKGCKRIDDNQDENRIKCSCDHMTNFAILVDLYGDETEDENHAIALDIITYIGCTLSIFGLLLTIITFMIFKKLRKGLGSQVLCNLAISLLLALIVFITGINQTSSKAGCIFVAALLHYLLLVAFCWMLVEAVLQYLRFVKVIGTYIPKFMLKASLCAWGIPLLISIIILVIDHNMYHGGKNYCWLKIKPFYVAFLLPVGLIMVSNVIIFSLVIYSIWCGRQKGLRTNQSERKLAITRLRAAFCILFLLGLSWTFGFFAISDARIVFKYLFSIFTTLQGFFIFVFHVLQEKTTRDLWYNYFCLKQEHGIQIFTTRNTSSAKDIITSSSTISRNKSSS